MVSFSAEFVLVKQQPWSEEQSYALLVREFQEIQFCKLQEGKAAPW